MINTIVQNGAAQEMTQVVIDNDVAEDRKEDPLLHALEDPTFLNSRYGKPQH